MKVTPSRIRARRGETIGAVTRASVVPGFSSGKFWILLAEVSQSHCRSDTQDHNIISYSTKPVESGLIMNTTRTAFLWAASILAVPMAEAAEDAVRPNIVVLLVDDLRWDEIGCAGHPFVRTTC